jgi:hypothetical protein
MKLRQMIMLAIAVLTGTASLTACGDVTYVEPRPVIIHRTPAPIIVRPMPAPIIVRPAPEVIIIRDRQAPRPRNNDNRPPATRPSDLGTYDASDGKAAGSHRDTSGRSTSFQRTGKKNRIDVLVPYVDKYGNTSDLRERHKVHVDANGREYINANGTGEKQYLNSDGTVGKRRTRRHR